MKVTPIRFFLSLIIIALLTASAAHAEDTKPKSDVQQLQDHGIEVERENGGMPPELPPPHFIRRKKPQPDILLRNKKEGFYVTPFPIIGFDPDTGFNLGAAAGFFSNGKKDSPFFRYTPYRWQVSSQFLITTNSVLQFLTYFDAPNFLDTPWRVRGEAEFFHNPFKNYFGIGNDGQQLTFPGTGQVYTSYSGYRNALKQQTGGATNERYDQYQYTRASLKGSAEYDLFGGWVRPLFGFQIARVWIGDYTGDTISGAVQNTTHLEEDCRSGKAAGCNGGWDNYIKLGLAFDTRDFEPNPTQGIFWELTSELSPKYLSSRSYGRLVTDLRAYGPLFKGYRQTVVLAGRFYYGWQFGDVPFYSMNTLAFTDRDWTGLGGYSSLRGYRLDRFIGPVQIMTNMELRWSFYDFTLFGQYLRLGIKPFFDAGRTFDKVSDTSFRGWHLGGGGGLMLAWNLSTVICLDYAVSSEGSTFYMEAGLQF